MRRKENFIMTLISHNVARIFYTEYKVKASETLKQIARDQLHDEKFAAEIKFKWDPGLPRVRS